MDTNEQQNNFAYDEQKEKLNVSEEEVQSTPPPISNTGLNLNQIIEKFIPIIGALFLVIGIGYFIYTTAWIHFNMVTRLGLGFLLSIAIIGGSFSFSERLKYLTDVGIGAGILLLYGTLIYGSRGTDITQALIPEVVTLFTAFLFIIAIAYFSSLRKSKAIIVLGMLGAYWTPFVIGQSNTWAQNISFNTYLIYFTAVNIAVFLLGREISIRKIIPLNIIGLFFGTSVLYYLSYANEINKNYSDNFFTGHVFTGILFTLLVIFTIWSILVSAKQFEEKDDGYLALGYLAPVVWFIYNINKIKDISDIEKGIFFALIALACFWGWHFIQGIKNRYQHTALYIAGLISVIFSFFSFLPELNVYYSMSISYLSLIFAILFIYRPDKIDRFVSYILVSVIGSFLSVLYISDSLTIHFKSLYVIVALLPAMSAYFIAKEGENKEILPISKFYSFFSLLITLIFILEDLFDYVDFNILFFYIAPFITLGYIAIFNKYSEDIKSHNLKSSLLRMTMLWFALGYFTVFLFLFASVSLPPKDLYIFSHHGQKFDMTLFKGIMGTMILFFGLSISRALQEEQTAKRPSFVLVVFAYISLILTGNYIINGIINDFGYKLANSGIRATATTVWWALIAIYMLIIGTKNGVRYHAEKVLGVFLLGVTIAKIILYDISSVNMRDKIFIFMIVGGLLLIFSYIAHSFNWFEKNDENIKKTESNNFEEQ